MKVAEEALVSTLSSLLNAEPVVILAFLFGSYSRGEGRTGSDVDVAVYLDLPEDEERIYQEVRRLTGRVADVVGTEVDMVSLNTAPPAIAAAALQGKQLVIRNERLYLELLCEKTREAEDLREWTFDLLRLRRRLREEASE